MKLIIEDDEGRRTVIPIVRDEITIGRNDQNMVRLEEKNVSRKHGRLVREDGHFYVEDLGSFTGIRVNGEKIKGKLLVKEGDLIQISEYDLMLQAGPDEKPVNGAGGLGGDDDESTLVRPDAADAGAEHATEPSQAAVDSEKRKLAETATIRLSVLKPGEAETPAQEVPPEKRPKLVGISGTYRGREFTLDKSPIRIGRSGDNDLEIEHPSISRRHFKLHVTPDGTWKVLDAESRNGVRVNGEPYAQIGLKHGDIMEIGHLRFAFVEPGKPFKLPSEFAPMLPGVGPVQPPKRGPGILIAVGAFFVVLFGIAAFFAIRHRASVSSSDDDGIEVVKGSKAERKFALRSAEDARSGHRYAEALRDLDTARRAGASAEELKDYNAVQAEARAEDLFREMESAASSQDWERARKLLGVLSESKTWYGAKASEKAESITAGYVNLHVAAAALMKGKDNPGCLAEAQLALAANPASADAQSLVDACKAGAPAQAAVPSKPAAPPKVAAASVARSGDDSAARQLVNDGNTKLVGQDYPGAIALYQKALALKPSDPVLGGIYRSMGIAYTRQGNIEEGARYYKLYLPLCTNPDEKAQLQKVLGDYESSRR